MTRRAARSGAGTAVSQTVTVAAAPDVVFALVADPRQHPRIDGSGSVRAVVDSPARLALDTRFQVRMKLFGVPYRISNRVVEFDEGRRIAWRHFGGHRWRYQLEPSGDGGTTVTETFDYSRYGPLPAALLRLTRFPERNRRGIRETLVRLRLAAEADAAGSESAEAGGD